jgi:hypothetical protein
MSEQGREPDGREASWVLRTAAPAVFALVLGLRLYLVFAGKVTADADECIVGLMARAIAAGLEHPLYFWGQRYGAGAGIEAHLLALLFLVKGSGAMLIKLLGLALWTVLVITTWRVGGLLFGPRAGWLTLLLMSASPQMALWSMKVRGGHVTALIALMLALGAFGRAWAALQDEGQGRRALALTAAAGALTTLAGWLQPVAAPAAAVILIGVGVALLFRQRFAPLAAMGAGAAAVLALAVIALPASAPHFFGPAFSPHPGAHSAPVRALATLAGTFAVHLDASLLDQPDQALVAIAVQVLAVLVWSGLLLVALVYNGLDLADDEDGERLPALILMAAVVVTPAVVIVAARAWCEPRHLLALYPCGALLMARAAARMADDLPVFSRAAVGTAIAAGLLVSAAMLGETRTYNPSSSAGLDLGSTASTIHLLQAHRINRVFCADAEFKWNLIFASREQVIARSWNPDDRRPDYVALVNQAALAGEPFAVVIPNPDLGDRRQLFEALQRAPHSNVEWVPGDVAIVYGVPADVAFKFFPLRAPGK